MKKSKKILIYNPNGSTNVSSVIGKTGVYIIYSSEGKIQYIGHSRSDLYKTLTRHFQVWNDGINKQYRAKFSKTEGYKTRLILCPSSKCLLLEEALINKYKPPYNQQITLLFPKGKKAAVLADLEKLEDLPF
jgi:excinuclease UvrABC nuclease subunit